MAWPQHRAPGLMLVLCGPSGAGKSSLISAYRARHPGVVESVSATTRDPRPGEVDGVDYHFLSDTAFVAKIADNGFLEHAQVFGRHRYGTPRAGVDQVLTNGGSVIMDIDVQGAAQIRTSMPAAVQIFVVPPDRATLEQRLRGRGTEDAEGVARRLAEADAELAAATDFGYLIVNDDLDQAVADLEAIASAERLRIQLGK